MRLNVRIKDLNDTDLELLVISFENGIEERLAYFTSEILCKDGKLLNRYKTEIEQTIKLYERVAKKYYGKEEGIELAEEFMKEYERIYDYMKK